MTLNLNNLEQTRQILLLVNSILPTRGCCSWYHQYREQYPWLIPLQNYVYKLSQQTRSQGV